ncbi:Myosin-11 [Hondaea fermentalgiana]|uniref:Myosin-11 n=1 Tax=Hondaea fermentalgiana TaxID=2315210 RepID=A0A2R5GW22_9STRA|nr:Myosin-11 [Hondaea fermentalgiana]|eukprot:GBG32611.1 Myosin-11 [Hondaea fermentalgiana]
MTDNDNEWHYTDANDADVGPVAISELVQQFKAGVIHQETFIWHPAQVQAWTLFKELDVSIRQKINPPKPRLTGPALVAATAAAKRRSGSQQRAAAPQPFPRQAAPPPQQPAPQQPSSNGNMVATRQMKRNVSAKGKSLLLNAGLATTESGWMERKTADGVPYYHNVSTGALSWDKPDEMKDAHEVENEAGTWVWVPDEDEGYLPGLLMQSRPDGRSVVQLENGNEVTTRPGQQVFPLTKSSLARTERDLTLLDSLDEGLILYNLRERFEKQQQIYTWIGTILISINPYETFPIYGVENIYTYKNRGNRILDPHVYVVADEALKPLLEYGENHSILISGESGAGKTWATKQCLAYLTEVTQRGGQAEAAQGSASVASVEGKILAANPILEAFGNAKTIRNDNSSRFGRFTEMHFKDSGKISGARIDNFLLEKSRVVRQGRGERNYHVFYQLLTSNRVSEFGLGSMESFAYLNGSGCYTVDGVDDRNEYQVLLQAFEEMGISQDEVDWIFELVAAILHLGNASFVSDGGEGSQVSSQGKSVMQWIARLLHVNEKDLEFGLVHRSIEVRGTVTNIPLKPHDAKDSRDALSKSIYGQLFDWLVERVNKSLTSVARPWAFIGLLDIFGFEIFEHNSFEQLCINFTNEKLQQIFNRDTFQLEERLYQSEGVDFEHIKYVDNQPILDMIEKKPVGLLLMLDDMNRMPRSTDEGFVAKADTNHSSSRSYVSSTITRKGNKCFTIKHYAGDVVYNADGFLAKNKDLLFKDLYDVMTASTSPKTAAMFPAMDKNSRAKYSLGAQFRKQLDQLMSILRATQTHYIRCVKPNDEKLPRTFNPSLSLEQLRYSGVFEAVRIRKQGFPFRYKYERFVERYKCVLLRGTKWVPIEGRTARDKTRFILDGTGQDFSEVRFGKTMALYRAEQHRLLELLRALALERVCAMIQAIARGYMARRFVQKVRFVQPKLEAAIRSRDVDQLSKALAEFSRVCGHFSSMVADTGVVAKAKRLRYALVEWEKVSQELNQVVRLDVANDDLAFEALKNAVWKAETLTDEPGTEWHMQMYDYSKNMFEEQRAARLEPKLQHAMDLLERDVMSEVYSECKNLRFEDPRLADIERFVGLNEEDLLKMQYRKAKKLGLAERAQDKEIRIREMTLDRIPDQFVFEQFNNFRDPAEFASHSLQFWKREELQRNMFKWQKGSIKTSLTQMDPGPAKQAVRLHKAILGWCGDKSNPNPNSLAFDVVQSGMSGQPLADEIYCQLIKQLHENPNQQSTSQAWKLLGVCATYFPPSTDLANYIHVFLRNAAPSHLKEALTKQLYDVEYNGCTSGNPTVDSIQNQASRWS